ncbi:hypothetical protein EF906_26660 [Streptomyces sp. WAC08241]|nr:hypothetical protein EF906_26660 [Streptomyces sp. WAC08241]
MQRLRDQGNAPSASTYKDLPSAQRLTQTALDDIDNAARIEEWIKKVERRQAANPQWNPDNSRIDPAVTLTFDEVTGSTVDRSEYAARGRNSTAADVHSVQVALRYKKGIDPPFVVVTTYPVSP